MSSDNEEEYLDSPPASDSDELEEVTELKERAYHVYSNIWSEFYTWEQADCQTSISRLSRGSYVRPAPLPPITNDRWEDTTLEEQDTHILIKDVDAITGRRSVVEVSFTPLLASNFKPCRRYTCCTPSSRNLKMNEDGYNDKALFANFADDTDFDLRVFLESKKTFAWEVDYADPDLEIIQMELVRRLSRQLFSSEDIGALDILPSLRRSNRDGLIWCSKQRDELRWSGSLQVVLTAEGHQLSSKDEIDLLQARCTNVSLTEAIKKGISQFCPLSNCLFSDCGTHLPSSHPIEIPLKPNLSADVIDNARRRDVNVAPCANECHKLWRDDDLRNKQTNPNWDINDHTLFDMIIKMAPDTTPCDLSVICRKPCVDVYVERVAFLSAAEPTVDNGKLPGTAKEQIEFLEDIPDKNNETPRSKPAGPCYHPGACNRFADCVCFHSKQRCLRSCRCSNSCERRFKGCNCHKQSRKKRRHKMFDCCDPNLEGKSQTCICAKRNRECDPELCMGLGYGGTRKHASHKANCKNMRLQKAKFASIHIRESKYGLGAFSTHRIANGDCIGEYVGEMASGGIDLTMLQNHVQLNYTYDVGNRATPSGNMLLDSWNLGNLTRYLNHENKTDTANCRAIVLFVAGDYRILIIANRNIRSGEELTLDYGETYWTRPEKKKRIAHPEDSYDPIYIQWEDS